MKTYNRYTHCGQKFYTGLNVKKIVCSECGDQVKFNDIIKTKQPISKQDDIKIKETYSSQEELQ